MNPLRQNPKTRFRQRRIYQTYFDDEQMLDPKFAIMEFFEAIENGSKDLWWGWLDKREREELVFQVKMQKRRVSEHFIAAPLRFVGTQTGRIRTNAPNIQCLERR